MGTTRLRETHMTNVLVKLRETVMDRQSETALEGEQSVTFSTLWSRTDAFAGGLADTDITAGDAVGIRLSTPGAFIISVLGTLRNGCVPVTIPPTAPTEEVIDALEETNAAAYVTDDPSFLSILNQVRSTRLAVTVDCDAFLGVDFTTFLDNDGINGAGSRTGIDILSRADDDDAVICYVDTDRGHRGVSYSHSTVVAATDVGSSVLDPVDGFTHLGSRPLWDPLELLYGSLATILHGGCYYPLSTWDAERVRGLVVTDAVDRTFLSPDQYEALELPDSESDLAVGILESTGARVDRPSMAATRLYGTPETGLTHIETTDSAGDSSVETLPGVRQRQLTDDTSERTELLVSGPATMNGYVSRPKLTERTMRSVDDHSWIRTGVSVENHS